MRCEPVFLLIAPTPEAALLNLLATARFHLVASPLLNRVPLMNTVTNNEVAVAE